MAEGGVVRTQILQPEGSGERCWGCDGPFSCRGVGEELGFPEGLVSPARFHVCIGRAGSVEGKVSFE